MTITKERSVNEGEDERVQGATICKLESLLKRSHLQRIMRRRKKYSHIYAMKVFQAGTVFLRGNGIVNRN